MASENSTAPTYQDGSGSFMDPDAGVKVRGGTGGYKTFRPANCATGNIPAYVSTFGNDSTPVTTETYIAQVDVPHACTITGIAVFNGSVASGNIKVAIADDAGTVLASSASTAMSGTDAYQRVDLSAPLTAVGGTYFVLQQIDNNTARVNTHTLGNFGASKKTGETYGTFTAVTPPTTFTTAVGPVASLYQELTTMTLPVGVTPGDLERGKFRDGTLPGQSTIAIVNSDGSKVAGGLGIFSLPYDYLKATYPDSVTEVYTSRTGGSGGAIQQAATVVYTDSTKASIDTVTRV